MTTVESVVEKNEIINVDIISKLKAKHVGDDKIVTEEIFNQIIEVSKNKVSLIIWLTTKVSEEKILVEDIYKFEEYFIIFEKHKQKYSEKNIQMYKEIDHINDFINQTIKIRENNIKYENINDSDRYVTQNEIEKLESLGIKYYGVCEEHQVFEITNSCKSNENAWKAYKDILGRCSGREQGAKIDICTMASFSYFKRYLEDYADSSYFVLFDLADPKSPYQLHYESSQFKDKNDNDIF